jgi:hypothetical protein
MGLNKDNRVGWPKALEALPILTSKFCVRTQMTVFKWKVIKSSPPLKSLKWGLQGY